MNAGNKPPGDPPPPVQQDASSWLDRGLEMFDKWGAVFVAFGSLLAAVANVKLLVEQQWAFAAAMLVVCAICLYFYYVSHRCLKPKTRLARFVRIGSYVTLACVPLVIAMVFYVIDFMPRTSEDGPIMAIARFEGPKLPPPYEDCRPSDMFTDVLMDVAHRYSHITAFELPYVIDPDGRWANKWATFHGLLAGADTVVYGEYSFVDEEKRDNKPDRLVISPEVEQVPMMPLGPKVAPLRHWDFPDRTVEIQRLCSGHSPRFLYDAKRLSLAIVGLQAFAAQHYLSAERALAEAERSHDNDDPDDSEPAPKGRKTVDEARCDRSPALSQCSGVLAFYLATLEQRLGHYATAEREYSFAAAKLNRPRTLCGPR